MGVLERKEREKEQRRNHILDAARNVLIEKGYNDASIIDISKRAEISVGTIYRYFKNKEEIFNVINRNIIEMLYDYIMKSIPADTSPRERLMSIGNSYLAFSEENAAFFETFSYFITFPDVVFEAEHRITQGTYGMKILNKVVLTIEEGIKKGMFREVNAQKYAILIWSTLHGILQVKKVCDLLYHDYNFSELYRYNLQYLIDSLNI
jgi:AcrR family transcriptional regulator